MTASHRVKLDAVIIFFCGLILFTLGLRHQEIIGFESRFYLFALEMWRHGLSWFPTTYHQPYPDYPVTSTFLIYGSAKLFGTLNKWVAVFPSAVAAAFTLTATYLLGALQERRWGWYGAGFLIFTLAFLMAARTISLDMYVTAVTAWIFYGVYSAKLQMKSPSWLIILLLFIFSFAIRGPIGIIIPAGVMGVFYLLEKDWRTFLLSGSLALLILLSCTGILLFIAYHAGGNALLQDVLRMEVLGRLQENQTPPLYFYFVESFGAYLLTYPLAILILLGSAVPLLRDHNSPRIHFLRMLLAWTLIIMLGLSIPADKKIRYILPIAPALALICSYLFIAAPTLYLQNVKKIFNLLCWIFPLLCLGGLSLLYQRQVELNYPVLMALFVTMQLFMLFSHNMTVHFFVAVLTFFVAYVFIIEKINLQANQAQMFVQGIEKMRNAQHAKLGFYPEGRDGLAIKYLVNMQNETDPLFIADLTALPKEPIVIVMSEENFAALPNKLHQLSPAVIRGKIGHDGVVVFLVGAK